LIDLILASGSGVLSEVYHMTYFPGDDLYAANRPRGLPIGNLTSQFWANVYLNPVDYFIRRQLGCTAYVRYVDDMLLFGHSKGDLWSWKRELVARLERYRLTIHSGAGPRPVEEGVPFLGFHIFQTGRRLKRRKGISYQRLLRKMVAAYRTGELDSGRLIASVMGWTNHVSYASTGGLQRSMLEILPPEIHMQLGVTG
jgi:hypothetical protein